MLKKSLFVAAFACLSFVPSGRARAQELNPNAPKTHPASSAEDLNEESDPPKLGIHWARDFQPSYRLHEATKQGKTSGALMLNHGGKILPYTKTEAIFWGTSWGSSAGDKITGMDTWYQGHGSSNYAATADEYSGSNGKVTSASTYMGHVVDGSPSAGGGSTSAILAEVCKVITNPDPSGNGYYAVYSDTPRGSAGYCAYHSSGSCNGVPVQFAYFFKLDGDPGCDPQDTSGLHSQGLAAIANVSGHELEEARTDPANPGAWYDGAGNENGDKCAWTFNVPLVTFSNGSRWKIQGEWSNAAYSAGTGYPNNSGQHGCIAGQ
ncbi:MAG: hypothetical protein NVS9B15_19510 [Acidobacteriaceae bacterium]